MDLQRLRDLNNDREGRVPDASLYAADVGTMKAGELSQILLRPAPFDSQLSDRFSKLLLIIHPRTIVGGCRKYVYRRIVTFRNRMHD